MRIIKQFVQATIIIGLIAISSLSIAKQSSLSQEDIERFGKAMAQVRQFYVKDLEDEDILDNALEGMLNGLDPHSDYLDEDEYQRLTESTQGQFAGLGIELTVEHGLIKVITPIDNTPASRAGIRSGDYIAEIDGHPVHEMTLDEAVNLMRGEKGTNIHLVVLRKSEKEPLKFTLTRDIINIVSVKSRLLDNDYGYIRISQFQKPTSQRLREALVSLEKKSNGKLQGLVLDLRNNPGGLLDSAIEVADAFLHSPDLRKYNEKIVYTKGRVPGAKMEAFASPGDILDGAPLIILINDGSASASEIVAGALQDYQRAIIMGKQSFGKGSVQTVLPLDKDHAIKLTTALYYTPSGRVIQAKGISPDIIVEDLTLKNNTHALILQPLKESTLTNHIQKEQPEGDALQKHLAKNQENGGLAQEDYQLNEALNLLKAMHFMNQKIATDIRR